jgi:hypothetical protein
MIMGNGAAQGFFGRGGFVAGGFLTPRSQLDVDGWRSVLNQPTAGR